MQRREGSLSADDVSPSKAGDTWINFGESTSLLVKPNNNIPVGAAGIDEDPRSSYNHNRNTNNDPNLHSTSTWLSDFPIFLSASWNNKIRRKCHTLFPRNNRLASNLVLALCYLLIISFSIFIFVAPIMVHRQDREAWCPLEGSWNITFNPYDNPDFIADPCRYERLPILLYFTLEECDICRRLLISVLLGGFIGYERRSADRPAGIRTMGLVSLGACFFTISSMLAFKSSTMGWDASRVTAALPSGVGFLGGALIWKGTVFVEDQEVHQVHGLTTAASLWLSAAVGVGVGGALYLVTTYVTVLVIIILRYGPKGYINEENEENDDGNDEAELEEDLGFNPVTDDNDDKSISKSVDAAISKAHSDCGHTRYSMLSKRKSASLRNIPTFNG